MAVVIVLIVSTLIFRAAGAMGFRPLASWRDATRSGLAVMFLFTGVAHFAPGVRDDMAAMIPPPFTGNLPIIYITGILEIAGAIGLLLPRFRRAAAICLILFLIAVFPANYYAAVRNVPLRGSPATPLAIRAPLQLAWIFLLWWSTLRSRVGTGETKVAAA